MRFIYEGGNPRPGMAVILCDKDMSLGLKIANRRQSEAVRMGLPDRHGYRGSGVDIHLAGAYGEIAVAGLLGVEWEATVNTFKRGGDVGSFQVRSRSKPYYDLIIRDDDRPQDIFWLVTGVAPHLRVVGWIEAMCGMKEQFRAKHGGREEAWFVPQSALMPLREIRNREPKATTFLASKA